MNDACVACKGPILSEQYDGKAPVTCLRCQGFFCFPCSKDPFYVEGIAWRDRGTHALCRVCRSSGILLGDKR